MSETQVGLCVTVVVLYAMTSFFVFVGGVYDLRPREAWAAALLWPLLAIIATCKGARSVIRMLWRS